MLQTPLGSASFGTLIPRSSTHSALLNRSFASSAIWLCCSALWGLCSGQEAQGGAPVYRSERVRVEFLPVPEVPVPGADVPLRFKVENRSAVRLAGTLDVGGPTRGILPRNEPSQRFQVEPGQAADLELKIAFAKDCVDGLYPVHAFFLLQEGGGDRAVLTRLVRPGFAGKKAEAGPVGAGRGLATFRPALVENVVDRFLEEKRLSVMADYARSLEDAAGRAYRLGTGEGSYRVLLVPGRQGMLDGYLYFSGPRSDLYFRGLRVTWQAPEGVNLDSGIEVVEYREEKRDHGLVGSHYLRLGEWETVLKVELEISGGEVKIRCESPDPVMELSLGEVSLAPSALTAGMGYRFAGPGAMEIQGASPLLDVRFARFEFGEGVRVTMGCDEPFQAIRLMPEEQHASVAVSGGQWLRVLPEEGEVPRFEGTGEAPPAGETVRQVPVMWMRRDCRNLAALEAEVKEWGRYEAGATGLLLEGWQAGEEEPVPPDVWPPRERAGGTAGLTGFAEVCRQAGVTLVLADRYHEISPLSRGFQFDAVEFDRESRPAVARRGVSYALRPDAVLAYFEENWKQMQFHLKPSAVYLGGVDAAGHEFFNREGHRFPPGWVRERWRANAQAVRLAAGGAALVISDGGGDWLKGSVDALVLDALTGFAVPPSRVPWWALLPGGGKPVLEPFAEDGTYPLARLSERVADGRLPLYGDEAWMHELLARNWFLKPVFERLRGRRIEGNRNEGGRRQWLVDWGGGYRVWINGGAQPWPREGGMILPPGGFWMEGPDLRGGVEVADGGVRERMETPQQRWLNPAAQASAPFPVMVRIESLTQLPGDKVELAAKWTRPELVPPGSTLRFFLAGPGEAGKEIAWGSEGVQVGEQVPSALALPASAVPPERDWEVALAIENASGRRLPLRSFGGGSADGGPALVRLGKVRRFEGEIPRWEASWRTEEEIAGAAVFPERPSADAGWAVSAGAFHLKKAGARWRLYALPCQKPFPVTLRGPLIEGFLPEVAEVLGRARKGDAVSKAAFRFENGMLTLRVDPEVLVYELLGPEEAAAAAAAAPPAEAPAQAPAAPDASQSKPGR